MSKQLTLPGMQPWYCNNCGLGFTREDYATDNVLPVVITANDGETWHHSETECEHLNCPNIDTEG